MLAKNRRKLGIERALNECERIIVDKIIKGESYVFIVDNLSDYDDLWKVTNVPKIYVNGLISRKEFMDLLKTKFPDCQIFNDMRRATPNNLAANDGTLYSGIVICWEGTQPQNYDNGEFTFQIPKSRC